MRKLVRDVIADIKKNPSRGREYLRVMLESGQVTPEQVRDYFDRKRLAREHDVNLFKGAA